MSIRANCSVPLGGGMFALARGTAKASYTMKHICLVGVLIAISLLLAGISADARDVEIALEAELANKIQAPMVIAVPDDAGAEAGPKPDEPSNGQFIWSPGAPLEGGPNGNKGYAEFIINIPEEDTYARWGHVVAWDGNSDSFWVVWEPTDPYENPQQTDNKDYRWSVSGGNAWHWDRIEAWLANDAHVEREWDMPAGETKLNIFCREDATMLDALFVTNNLGNTAAEVGARLPTDEDRQLQVEGVVGQTVEIAGKLSIAWADLKRP